MSAPDCSQALIPECAAQGGPGSAADAPWTLLAVDDEPNILAALRRLFRATGWRFLTAERAEEALALLAREPVDAVLSDMRMPGMNGVQLLEEVGRSWPRTARMLLTGQADLGATIAAINRGRLHRYITKPWNDDELVRTLRQVAQGQQVEAEKAALERLTRRQNEELKTLNVELEARVALRTAELAAANDRLKRNYLTSIKAFTALIDLRGSAQFGHARQVADLTRRIAQVMEAVARLAIRPSCGGGLEAFPHRLGPVGLRGQAAEVVKVVAELTPGLGGASASARQTRCCCGERSACASTRKTRAGKWPRSAARSRGTCASASCRPPRSSCCQRPPAA